MKLFVVQMFRYGNQDAHSYIEGVYTTMRLAKKHGRSEEISRALKYECQIWTHTLNKPRDLKYLADKTVQKRGAKALKWLRHEHPTWFDKRGRLKV